MERSDGNVYSSNVYECDPDRKAMGVGGVKFTKRQKEVLDLAITGMAEKEIATKLGLTYRTVELYLTRIYREAEIDGNIKNKRIRLMNKIREER